MECTFDVKLTTGKIFHFLFFNAYTGSGPLISAALAVILIVFGALKGGLVYSFFGVMFLITAPIVLYTRAFRDIHKKNSPYKIPMHYVFTEKNVRITQGTQQVSLTWKTFTSALITPSSLALYTDNSAYIIPKEDAGEQYDALLELVGRKTEIQKLFQKKKSAK